MVLSLPRGFGSSVAWMMKVLVMPLPLALTTLVVVGLALELDMERYIIVV